MLLIDRNNSIRKIHLNQFIQISQKLLMKILKNILDKNLMI